MSLGGGGGNEKHEGEGGGSTLGSWGEAMYMEGFQQSPHRHQDALPQEDPDGRDSVESLGALPEGAGVRGTIGGNILILVPWFSLSCLVFSFLFCLFLSFLFGLLFFSVYVCVLHFCVCPDQLATCGCISHGRGGKVTGLGLGLWWRLLSHCRP